MTEATKYFVGGAGLEHKCPWCGHINARQNSIKLCGDCHAKYVEKHGKRGLRAMYDIPQITTTKEQP